MLALVLGGLCCSLIVACGALLNSRRHERRKRKAAEARAAVLLERERQREAGERDWREVILPFPRMHQQPDLRTYSECDDEDRDAVHGWTKHKPREGGR